ncbi:MAG: LON peptidase substrate-binding domain-containing protein [Bacteroidota bacterium]
MPISLPLFPLSLVVFPGEELRLHIFEPRYRQLIHECVDEGITFGIPPVINRKVSLVATEVELLRLDKQYSSGEMDITTRGIRRVQINQFHQVAEPKLYPGGEIEYKINLDETDHGLQEVIFDQLEKLHDALGIQRKVARTVEEIAAFSIGHQVGLTLQQEHELLKIDSEVDRLAYLQEHLERIIPIVRETERLKARAKLNGHYKNVLPPKY